MCSNGQKYSTILPGFEEFPYAKIVVDTSGNSFVAGSIGYSAGGYSYSVLIKYNSNGDSVWVKKYYGNNNCDCTSPSGLILDRLGNIYMSGGDHSLGSTQTFLIRYNQNGDSLWKRNHYERGYAGCSTNSIAIDLNGNIYLGVMNEIITEGII